MKRFLAKLFFSAGLFCGWCYRIVFPCGVAYLSYLFQRGVATGEHKARFGKWGVGSCVAPDLQLRHPEKIKIGKNVSILKHCVLEVCGENGEIVLGDDIHLGEYCHITATQKVEIGSGVLTGRFVLITDNAHGNSIRQELDMPPLSRPVVSRGEVVIGKNVWLGDKVSVLPGAHIGDGAIIGANSVVTKDIPAFVMAAGIPCRVLKEISK